MYVPSDLNVTVLSLSQASAISALTPFTVKMTLDVNQVFEDPPVRISFFEVAIATSFLQDAKADSATNGIKSKIFIKN